MVVVRQLAGMTALVAGGAGTDAARAVAEALRARGAECELTEIGSPEAGRRFAVDFRSRHDKLHRLVLASPDTAAHHAITAELFALLLAAGSPSYGPPSRIVIAGRLTRLDRSWVANLQLVRGLHQRLKDASLSRRVQCVAALGAECLVEAVCDPALRSGECVAPAGLAGRVGAPGRGVLPSAAGSRAQAERLLTRLDDGDGPGFEPLRRRADELERRRLELASGERRISAMVRARNEEEFLRPAVESILAAVDEVVLVENQSDDRTPEIAARLAAENPEKVRLLEYPHRIARVGSQQRDASDGRGELRSIHEHCNWVLERCRFPFVLKWDADMVALPAFHAWLQRWRESERVVMAFHGANVHPDREHLLAARCSDRAQLETRLGGGDLPEWATRLTYDSVEPRLFPHWEAHFDGSWQYLEAHVSPFFFGTQRRRARLEPDEPCFLHMKFCKRDPFAFYMPNIAAVIRDNMGTGPALTDEQRETLERWTPRRD